EEVARLQAILDTVAGGSGQVVLLTGELGAGKTRLAQEIMVAAVNQGFVVGTGRCYQSEQVILYEVMLEALADLAVRAPDAARAEVQHHRQELESLLRDAASTSGAETDVLQQHQFFADVAELLVVLARWMPVAVLLDDLHWADEGTVKLLRHLAQATRSA